MVFKFLFLILIIQSTSALDLKVCYESAGYYPYLTNANSDENPGILLEIILAAAKKTELNLVLYRSSWKRCQTDLKRGHADGIFAAIWSLEREGWASFPKNKKSEVDDRRYLWKSIYKVHVSKDSKLTWNGKQFSQKDVKVAAPRGYIAYQMLEDLNVLPEVIYKASQGLKLVGKKRLDGYVIEEQIGKNLIRKNGLTKQVVSIENNFFEALWYLPLSKSFYKKNPKVAEKFFTAINESRIKLRIDLIKKYE